MDRAEAGEAEVGGGVLVVWGYCLVRPRNQVSIRELPAHEPRVHRPWLALGWQN